MVYCSKCGHMNNHSNSFCTRCGAELSNSGSSFPDRSVNPDRLRYASDILSKLRGVNSFVFVTAVLLNIPLLNFVGFLCLAQLCLTSKDLVKDTDRVLTDCNLNRFSYICRNVNLLNGIILLFSILALLLLSLNYLDYFKVYGTQELSNLNHENIGVFLKHIGSSSMTVYYTIIAYVIFFISLSSYKRLLQCTDILDKVVSGRNPQDIELKYQFQIFLLFIILMVLCVFSMFMIAASGYSLREVNFNQVNKTETISSYQPAADESSRVTGTLNIIPDGRYKCSSNVLNTRIPLNDDGSVYVYMNSFSKVIKGNQLEDIVNGRLVNGNNASSDNITKSFISSRKGTYRISGDKYIVNFYSHDYYLDGKKINTGSDTLGEQPPGLIEFIHNGFNITSNVPEINFTEIDSCLKE